MITSFAVGEGGVVAVVIAGVAGVVVGRCGGPAVHLEIIGVAMPPTG
jgi:hypothetical protein